MTTENKAFKSQLSDEELEVFNDVASKPFGQQAVHFLNAYWEEIGDQAAFIFNVAYENFKAIDMEYRGILYVFKYEDGVKLEFDAALNFFERMCKQLDDSDEKNCEENEYVGNEIYAKSIPNMMTSLSRKKELRNKVDVNFDGHVSFLEYLLYTYQDECSPSEFITKEIEIRERSQQSEEPQGIQEAREALERVRAKIAEYEARKAKLTKKAKKSGVSGLSAKNELEQLSTSEIANDLRKELITAEAKVRIVSKKYGADNTPGGTSTSSHKGTRFWMQSELNHMKNKCTKSGLKKIK